MFAPPVAKQKQSDSKVVHRNRLQPINHAERVLPEKRVHAFLERPDPRQGEPASNPQQVEPARSWNFVNVPLFPPDLPARSQRPQAPNWSKRDGAADGMLEREANRIANLVMRAPPSTSRVRPNHSTATTRMAATTGDQLHPTAPAPESFKGRGDPLPPSVRGFFEQRLDYDFAGVRVHHGHDAAQSARSLGARAYTHGRDIVFGVGAYSPGSLHTTQLLAHELTHVVQQGARQPLVQRSPLSDSIKDAWTADPKIESLLKRLGQPDVQAARTDIDVDTEIAHMLASRPDDLWVAQQIRQGQLGQRTGQSAAKSAGKPAPQPIKAVFVPGSTDRRALVIGGVHGTERQGIEVADQLVHDLQSPGQPPPAFTTIIVPSLFPDNATAGRREGTTPTNRNFPPPSEDLAAATAVGGGRAVDASTDPGGRRTRAILPENLLLIALIERFHPERIISIHGSFRAGESGVFYDRRSPSEEEDRTARELAKGQEGGQPLPPAVQERHYRARLAAISEGAEETDRALSLKAAAEIDVHTAAIKGREARSMAREKDSAATTAKNLAARRAHPSIAGNIGPTGKIENATWLGSIPGGVSLGGYAPPRGISVFTVEPPVDAASAAYPDAKSGTKPKAWAKDIVTGAEDKLTRADRITELQAYADAVRTILLG